MARPRDIETEVSEAVVIRSTAGFGDAREQQGVWLWDCGPEQPVSPKDPEVPEGKRGEPKFDLAMLRYERALASYKKALDRYDAQEVEYADFEARYGGPYEIWMWSVDAQDALTNDGAAVKARLQSRRRYFISARTRGYEALPNGGLPTEMKPGHGQAELLRRQAEGEAEMGNLRKADPVFGSEVRP